MGCVKQDKKYLCACGVCQFWEISRFRVCPFFHQDDNACANPEAHAWADDKAKIEEQTAEIEKLKDELRRAKAALDDAAFAPLDEVTDRLCAVIEILDKTTGGTI